MLDSRFHIDAEDESGAIVYSLSLQHAHAEFCPAPLSTQTGHKPTARFDQTDTIETQAGISSS
jgi:hypothetical protein